MEYFMGPCNTCHPASIECLSFKRFYESAQKISYAYERQRGDFNSPDENFMGLYRIDARHPLAHGAKTDAMVN